MVETFWVGLSRVLRYTDPDTAESGKTPMSLALVGCSPISTSEGADFGEGIPVSAVLG